MEFYHSLSTYERRRTNQVQVGSIFMGSDYPVRVQSMTTTNTLDTEASVEQCARIFEAGADLVRLTAQGAREAGNLRFIRKRLIELEYHLPLVADIHFNPNAADIAAQTVEKVRINPGNFVDKRASFEHLEFTDEEYAAELENLRARFVKLLDICKSNYTALRIGVNHGSLSDRIMSRYGDTPAGMVESAMEFLRICIDEDFSNVVLSMKASNVRVMVQAYRLLVKRMSEEGMRFPLHLGVTEAGEGEDGRIKSAVGIGALLADGIGDTIRVSLTEEPENEIPVAKELVDYFEERKSHAPIADVNAVLYSPYSYQRSFSSPVLFVGGENVPVVVADASQEELFDDAFVESCGYQLVGSKWERKSSNAPDFFIANKSAVKLSATEGLQIFGDNIPVYQYSAELDISNDPALVTFDASADAMEATMWLRSHPQAIVRLETHNSNGYGEQRAFMLNVKSLGASNPIIVSRHYTDKHLASVQLKAAADLGPLFVDGLADGIEMTSKAKLGVMELVSASFSILQAARVRVSKTEYISCPGCGRTLYNLRETAAKIRERTKHLVGLKIGIMGCIVNGPGEMADADYGYVGAGPGKVSLYKGKTAIKKSIPEEQALDELVAIIKENGDWNEQS